MGTDTAKCIEIAINNPPEKGERVEMKMLPNPRQEAAENELDVSNKKFCNLGLNPVTLDTGLFEEVTEIVKKYKDRCNPKKILPASFWNKQRAVDCEELDPSSIEFK